MTLQAVVRREQSDLTHNCNNQPYCTQVSTMMQPHGLLLCFKLLHMYNSSVSASLVGHVLYSADLMSAICIPHYYLMVHRYIYSRYSPVFPMLYQLYHSLPSSTLISSSSLYLSVATWVTPQGCYNNTANTIVGREHSGLTSTQIS